MNQIEVGVGAMIDPKIKEAWAKYKLDDWSGCGNFIRAYKDAEARARMAEWRAINIVNYIHEDGYIAWRFKDENDPRHTWDLAKWREELEGELNA